VVEIRKQARTRLQAVLTPEQWKQLEELEKNDRRPGEPDER
jgi:Spy/CpxP family protein refolding chaperone